LHAKFDEHIAADGAHGILNIKNPEELEKEKAETKAIKEAEAEAVLRKCSNGTEWRNCRLNHHHHSLLRWHPNSHTL
jgi:hypothetical protein